MCSVCVDVPYKLRGERVTPVLTALSELLSDTLNLKFDIFEANKHLILGVI